jgi:hypothetical protein
LKSCIVAAKIGNRNGIRRMSEKLLLYNFKRPLN